MIALGFMCVLGAVALLIVGLTQPDQGLIWASIGVSLLGGLIVLLTKAVSGRKLPVAEAGNPKHQAGGPMYEDTTVFGATPIQTETDPHIETAVPQETTAPDEPKEPPEEAVRMTDVLTVMELEDEVRVVNLRSHYHLAACSHIRHRETVPLPINEAREAGFTPCGLCRPDSTLAAAARKVSH